MNPSKQNVSLDLYLSIFFHCILISAQGIILLTPREQSKWGVMGNLYMLVFSHFFTEVSFQHQNGTLNVLSLKI